MKKNRFDSRWRYQSNPVVTVFFRILGTVGGHLLAFGDTGSGKTTLINFIMANFRRTPTDQFIGIDFGYRMYTTCAFLGGTHIDPRGFNDSYSFSLFTHIDEASERSWLVSLLTAICEINGLNVDNHDREMLENTIEIFSRTPHENRSLSTFLGKLPGRVNDIRSTFQQYTIAGIYEGILREHGKFGLAVVVQLTQCDVVTYRAR